MCHSSLGRLHLIRSAVSPVSALWLEAGQFHCTMRLRVLIPIYAASCCGMASPAAAFGLAPPRHRLHAAASVGVGVGLPSENSYATSTTMRRRRSAAFGGRLSAVASDGDDDGDNNNDDDDDDDNVPSDDSLLKSLQSRLAQINTDRNAVIKRWRKGKCTSSIRLSLDDWVRRLDVAHWPLAVVGSAGGSVYLCDLNLGISLVKAEGAHDAQGGDEEMLELLYGQYDGGGTVAVAVGGPNGRLVVTAGREGGALAWRIGGAATSIAAAGASDDSDDEDNDDVDGIGGGSTSGGSNNTSRGEDLLECLGELGPLVGTAVTCVKIDAEGRVWAGCFDGTVHCIHLDNLVNNRNAKPRVADCGSPVLSLDVGEDIDCIAAGTASGTVHLFSTDEDLDEGPGQLRKLGEWTPKKDMPARSVVIAPFPVSLCGISSEENDSDDRDYDNEEDFAWSLVSGGNDGCLHAIPLSIDCDSDVIDEEFPLGTSVEEDTVAMQPPHNGPVTSLAWRKGGILLSGAQDGTIRVWDSTPRCASDASVNQGVSEVAYDPRCLFGLGGYKVWLGSVVTGDNGLRLISDGSDNTVIVHNFSPEGDADGQELQGPEAGGDNDDDDGDSGGGGGNIDNDFDDEAAFM